MAGTIREQNVIVKYNAESGELEKGSRAASKAVKDVGTVSKDTQKAIDESIRSADKYSTALKNVSTRLDEAKSQSKQLSAAIREQQKISQEFEKELLNVNARLKDVKRFSQEYGQLTSLQKNLSEAIKDNANAIKGLKIDKSNVDATVKSLTEEEKALKNANKELDRNKTFSDRASAALDLFGINTLKVTSGISGIKTVLQGLKATLISTGIGAIVVLIGTLAAGFLSTQRGADFLTRQMNRLKVAFDFLLGGLQELAGKAEAWFKLLFEDPKQAVIDLGTAIKNELLERFKALAAIGPAISLLLSGKFKEGFTVLGNVIGKVSFGVDDLSTKLDTVVEKADALTNSMIKLEEREISLVTRLAKLNNQFIDQREILTDIRNSYEDRIAAGEKAQELQRKIGQAEIEQERIRLQILKEKTPFTERDRELRLQIAESEARIIDLEAEANRKNLERLTETNNVRKQQAAERKKNQEDEAKRLLELIKLTETQIEAVGRELQERKEQLGLVAGVKEFTELELKAIQALEKNAADAITKILEDAAAERIKIAEDRLAKAISAEERANAISLLNYETQQLAELAAFTGTEEEKQKLREKFAKEQLVQQQKLLTDMLSLLEATDLSLVSEETKDATVERIAKIKNEIAKLGDQIGTTNVKAKDSLEVYKAVTQGVSDVSTAVLDNLTKANDAVVEALNNEVSAQESRVEKFTELARTGSAKQLQIEQERLDKLQAEREKAVEKQRVLANAQILINQAVTLSNAIASVVSGFATGGPAGIATGIAQLIALGAAVAAIGVTVSNAFSGIPAFHEGTEFLQGPQGRDRIPAMLEHGERVVPADINRKLNVPNAVLPHAVAAWNSYPYLAKSIEESTTRQVDAINALKDEVSAMRRERGGTSVKFLAGRKGLSALVSEYHAEQNWMKIQAR